MKKKKSNVVNWMLMILAVGLLSFSQLTAQESPTTTDQIRQQAESKLKTMTRTEIDAKIKEMGLTREQAIQKANEYGVSLEDFVGGKIMEIPKREEEKKPDEIQQKEKPKDLETSKKSVKDSIDIPGFTGRTGISSLIKPYGYDIFQYPASTFEPVMNVATPPTYALGVGDEVIITVWGETRLNYTLTINKEGNIVVPDVGPVNAVGNTMKQLRDKLIKRMSGVYSSLRDGATNAPSSMDVSLGKLKTIQVFVLGEVVHPGGYSLSSFSTIMQALYLSGGPTVNGSLREVQLKRDGKNFKTLDVYDYLTKADNSKDVRLQDGDIVLIKPVGRRVAMIGNLFRPAIYELRPDEKLKDVLVVAGGLLFDTYFNRVHIERIIPFENRRKYQKNLLDIDINFQSIDDLTSNTFEISDGDIVSFYKINDFFQNRLTISGNVKKPGNYEFKEGMTVKDLIVKSDSLIGVTFSRGFIFRVMPDFKKEVISFDPNKALEENPLNNIALKNEDSVVVYKKISFYPARLVTINGEVRKPGRYQRNENMSLSDLIVVAGGLTENAFTDSVEISRLDTLDIKKYMIPVKVAISKNYWEEGNGLSTVLKDLDYIYVSRDPKIGFVKLVTVKGLVKYPGVYPLIKEGERIDDIIDRAGGFLDNAYLEGATFLRKENNVGKIPFDLKNAYSDRSSVDNVLVVGGDEIYVPMRDDVVYMKGEFYVPLPVLYKPGASIDYYVSQAGGFTDEANEGAVSAYLPSGKKWEPRWSILPDPDILPGSTIIAPKKVEKPDTVFPLIRDMVTTIASLAAITVAIVQITK